MSVAQPCGLWWSDASRLETMVTMFNFFFLGGFSSIGISIAGIFQVTAHSMSSSIILYCLYCFRQLFCFIHAVYCLVFSFPWFSLCAQDQYPLGPYARRCKLPAHLWKLDIEQLHHFFFFFYILIRNALPAFFLTYCLKPFQSSQYCFIHISSFQMYSFLLVNV